MSEAIQAKRLRERFQDFLATLAVTGFLTAAVALLCEGLIVLAGLALGDPAWHRSWVDQRLAHVLEWLRGVPVLGAFVGIFGQPNTWLPSGGIPRDLIALFVTLYGPILYLTHRIGPTLIARYDDETLRVLPSGDYGLRWAGPLGEAQHKAWQALSEWCFAGAGDGTCPLWPPWAQPSVEQRFSIAILTGPNGVGKSHLAEALSRELDGSLRLEACTSRLARLRLRLGVKLNESAWWKPRRREDPWDSGYLVEDPAALVRLAGFLPRRATLLVADELTPLTLLDAITKLKGRRADFRHPVRLLIIDTVLPGCLGLGLDAERRVWTTNIHELGEVPVVSLSDVRFAPPEFRGLVGAQVGADGQRMQLLGRDVTWQPLIEALDGQPVLLAESIRQVREQKTTFESLCGDNDLADKHASLEEPGKREPVMLPADILGVRRALLRERLLGGRAQHRKQAIRAALGADTAGGEEAYYALMVATLAGGCASPRLCKLLGWTVDKLGDERLARVFGRDATPKWIPPIKPAVIADEMLRDHFRAPRNASLDEESRQHIARALHIAWLCNPAGTLRTVARWVARRQRDEFAQALATPPGLDLLTEVERLPGLSPAETRVEIARAFFELAVCHDGELAVAEAAMGALDKDELTLLGRQVDALLSRPEVRGLPALILWLQLETRCWPDLATLGLEKTREFGLKLLGCAEHLVRQSRLMAVWETPLQAALKAALKEIQPRVAELADACAADVAFRQAAWALEQSARQDPGVLQDLRQRLRTALAASLAGDDALPSGEPAPWARALLARLALLDLIGPRPPDIAAWLAGEAGQQTATTDEAEAWAKARLLSLMAFSVVFHDPAAMEKAARRVADIAHDFPRHEGIQYQCAGTWRNLAWAHKDHDPVATEKVAQRVAIIASNFPHNEDIQFECAKAWRVVVDAAVRIDDEMLINQALDSLDDLAGLDRQGRTLPTWNPRPTFPGVLQERDTANAMVKAWREAQATNEAPQ